MYNNTLKGYYIKINSMDEIEAGDVVLISNSSPFFRFKNYGKLSRGIVVKKNKNNIFKKNECIVYNINTLNYPSKNSVNKILSYFNDNEYEILNNGFEFINNFSKGYAVYLVEKTENLYSK